ncbi:MAG: alpha/beta hydrolase [Novosphingobium sp.]
MKSAETQASPDRARFDRPRFDRRAIPAEAVEARWALPDGHELRRIDWPGGAPVRGSLLFMPGRGDNYEKYLETLAHWAGQGWRVTAADWRGQAGSGRLGADGVTGHIDDFGTWVADLAALWAAWRAATPGPHVLVGHSMGGHLVLRALAERRVDPDAAVLSVPMLGFAGPPLPGWLLHAAARAMAGIGDRRRPAWKWSEKPGEMPADRVNLLTHDPERYADELWWRAHRPELVMGPGSWGWTERAFASMRGLSRPGALEAVAAPVLLIGVTGDKLVGFGAIERAARRLPHGELLRFGAEAHHEVLRESDPVRDRALAGIDEFLARTAPAEPA